MSISSIAITKYWLLFNLFADEKWMISLALVMLASLYYVGKYVGKNEIATIEKVLSLCRLRLENFLYH